MEQLGARLEKWENSVQDWSKVAQVGPSSFGGMKQLGAMPPKPEQIDRRLEQFGEGLKQFGQGLKQFGQRLKQFG